MTILSRLDALSRALTAQRWPALSSWWLETLTRFVTSRRRQLVCRVGRRGGKSSTLCRYAVAFALAYACTSIPPGDVGVVAIISVSRDEANQRLRAIKAILDAIHVKWKPIEGGIELTDRPIAFKVFAATVAGVVGFTSILVICDEVARWRDADTGANPAREVLASVRPTMATQPEARIVLSSSVLSTVDSHAEAFELGDTDFQIVVEAQTWIANPTITEADTIALEPDPRIRAREYGNVPSAAVAGAFDPAAVDAAMLDRVVPPGVLLGRPIIMIDASSGRSDSWTWACVRWLVPASRQFKMTKRYVGLGRWCWDYATDARGQRIELEPSEHFPPVVRVEWIKSVDGQFWKQLSAATITARIIDDVRAVDAERVVGDQREAFALSSLFASKGVAFTSLAWTNPTKTAAVECVRRWMRDGQLWLPKDDILRAELLGFEERITPSGVFTYGARGNRHDDRVALLLTSAMAEGSGLLSMSPYVARQRRDLTHLPVA